MITPFKGVLGDRYKDIEARLEASVHIRFGLPAALPDYVKKTIKRADRMAAWLEATQLAGFSEQDASKIFPKPRGTPASMRLRARAPADAACQFLRRFAILGGNRKINL